MKKIIIFKIIIFIIMSASCIPCLYAADPSGGTIDSDNNGRYNSMVVDTNGYPHISYSNHIIYKINYARWDGTQWKIEDIGSSSTSSIPNTFTSIALDNSNLPHIAYVRSETSIGRRNFCFYRSKNAENTWNSEVKIGDNCQPEASSISPGEPAIVMDRNNIPHIFYVNDDEKKIYHSINGALAQAIVTAGDRPGDTYYPLHIDACVDNNNTIHLSFYAGTADTQRTIYYGSLAGNTLTFKKLTVDTNDYLSTNKNQARTAIAASGTSIYIAYYNTGKLYYAYRKDTSTPWSIEAISDAASSNFGTYTSMVIDTIGIPHIAYRDEINAKIKWAYKKLGEPPTWKISDIDTYSGTYNTSIGVNNNKKIYISYYYDNTTSNNLRLAVKDLPDATPPGTPIVTSSTHPDSNTWYKNNTPFFTMMANDPEAASLTYYYVLDRNSGTIPTTGSSSLVDATPADGISKTFAPLAEDGIWYFHVIAQNPEGLLSSATHYKIQIDYTAPAEITPINITDYQTTSLTVSAAASDALNNGVSYYFDRNNGQMISGWLSSGIWTDAGLTPNTQYLYKVKYKDNIGNESSFGSPITCYTLCQTPPKPTSNTPTQNSITLTINPGGNPDATSYAIFGQKYTTGWEDLGYLHENKGSFSTTLYYRTKTEWETTGLIITGLSSNTQYRFTIRARNGDGKSTSLDPDANGLVVTTLSLIEPILGIEPASALNPSTPLTFTPDIDNHYTPQTVQVVNTGTGLLDWSAAASQTWIQLNPASGNSVVNGSPHSVIVSVNTAGFSLSAGTYNETITFNSPGQTAKIVYVKITVPNPAQLQVSPMGWSFTKDNDYAPTNITLKNIGGVKLDWRATVPPEATAWLTINTSNGSLNPGAEQQITVSINTSAMTAGIPYNAYIPFTGGISPPTISVYAYIPTPGDLYVNTSFFSFDKTDNFASQSIILTNSGGSQVSWNAEVTQGGSWLSVAPLSGTIDAMSSKNDISISVNPYGMTEGQYTGKIIFSAPGKTIPITVTMSVPSKPSTPTASVNESFLSNSAPNYFNTAVSIIFNATEANEVHYTFTTADNEVVPSDPLSPTKIDPGSTTIPFNRSFDVNPSMTKTSYKIKAKAWNDAGESAIGGIWTIVIDKQIPGNPTLVLEDRDRSNQEGTDYLNFTNEQTIKVSISAFASDIESYILNESQSVKPDASSSNWRTTPGPTAYTFTNNTQGSKIVYLWVKDYAGNINSGIVSKTITFDTQPPQEPFLFNVSGAQENAVSTQNISLQTITATGAYYMFISGNFDTHSSINKWITYSSTVSGLPLTEGEGQKTITIKFKDKAGNLSSEVSKNIKLDLSAPTITSFSIQALSVFGTQKYTNTNTVLLTISASDATSIQMKTYETSEPSEWLSLQTSYDYTFENNTEGFKTINLKLRDVFSHTTSAVSDEIIYDKTPPRNCSVSINNDATITTSRFVTLKLKATDTYGVQKAVITQEGTSYTEDWPDGATEIIKDYILQSDEEKKDILITVDFYDKANNKTSTQALITFDQSYRILLSNIPAIITFDRNIDIAVSDTNNNLAQYEYTLDGIPYSAQNVSIHIVKNNLSIGNHILTVKAVSLTQAGDPPTEAYFAWTIIESTEPIFQPEQAVGLSVDAPTYVPINKELFITIIPIRKDGSHAIYHVGELLLSADNTHVQMPSKYLLAYDEALKQVPKAQIPITFTGIGNFTITAQIERAIITKTFRAVVTENETTQLSTIIELSAPDGTQFTTDRNNLTSQIEIACGIPIKQPTSSVSTWHYTPTGIMRELINLLTVQEINKSVRNYVPDSTSFGDGLLTIPYSEASSFDSASLKICYFNQDISAWELLPGEQTIDTSAKTITAHVNRLGVYQIMGMYTAQSLDNVKVYPNPFNPNTAVGHVMKITNLPDNTEMKIYTMAGELVKTLSTADFPNQGFIEWDGRNEDGNEVAQGVYFYLIKSPASSIKGKFALIKK